MFINFISKYFRKYIIDAYRYNYIFSVILRVIVQHYNIQEQYLIISNLNKCMDLNIQYLYILKHNEKKIGNNLLFYKNK